jgi:hypothetical protein
MLEIVVVAVVVKILKVFEDLEEIGNQQLVLQLVVASVQPVVEVMVDVGELLFVFLQSGNDSPLVEV